MTKRGDLTFRQGGDGDDAQVEVGDGDGTDVPPQALQRRQLERDLVLVQDLQEPHLRGHAGVTRGAGHTLPPRPRQPTLGTGTHCRARGKAGAPAAS